jgi:hypothetical protein
VDRERLPLAIHKQSLGNKPIDKPLPASGIHLPPATVGVQQGGDQLALAGPHKRVVGQGRVLGSGDQQIGSCVTLRSG